MQIAIRPAKPFALGLLDGTPDPGPSPGNPVSSFVSLRAAGPPAPAPHGRPRRPRPTPSSGGRRRGPAPAARRKTHFLGSAPLRRDALRVAPVGAQGSHQLAARIADCCRCCPNVRGWRPATASTCCLLGARGDLDPEPVTYRMVCDAAPPTRSVRVPATFASPSPTVQLPVHLLHAGGGDWSGCPGRSCSPTRRRADRAVCVDRFVIDAIRLTVASRLCAAGLPDLVARLARLGCRRRVSPPTFRGSTPWPGAGRGRLRRITSPATPFTTGASPSSPGRRPPVRAVGHRLRIEAGLDPVKLNVVLRRGVTRGRGRLLRRVGRPRASRALHRVHAPRRRRGLVHGRGRARPGDRRRHRRRVPPGARAPRSRARGPLALRGRARRDRGDRLGHRAVLRGLRPHPPHRGRSAARLPVRHRRGGSSPGPARRR